ncbi:MAG: 30S ribosomal protein S3, partial [Betaproteobacteria bacterium]|nr:30S ribosomal protein S3 [Betaproteobacteria bacterium]
KTTYGVIGIKVWVFKGEVMKKSDQPIAAAAAAAAGLPAPSAEKPAPALESKDKPKKPRRAPVRKAGAKNAATRKA